LDFFSNNFDVSNSIIVFRNKRIERNKYNPTLESNIIYIENYKKFLFTLAAKLISARKIIMHYYPIGPSLFFWYLFSFLFKKTTWILWGGDLYFFQEKKKKLSSYLYEFIRQRTIKKFKTIACFIKGDYEIARLVYKAKADYKYICYPIPVNFSYLEKILFEVPTKSDNINVLLGNSATPSNNHIEGIDILKYFLCENIIVNYFLCENIIVNVPLSYPDEKEYVNEIINYGNRILGDKFNPITTLMNPENYGKFLSQIDIAIMNHQRQQGLGNVLSLLYLGKKVYLRSDTTSFKFLLSLGIKLYDTITIKSLTFEQFCYMDKETKEKNYQIIKKEFSNESYISMWKKVIE